MNDNLVLFYGIRFITILINLQLLLTDQSSIEYQSNPKESIKFKKASSKIQLSLCTKLLILVDLGLKFIL